MKPSEEQKLEVKDTLINGIVFGAGSLIMLLMTVIAGVSEAVVVFSVLLCFVILVFTVAYWTDKKTQRELEQYEAQEEQERHR